MNPDEDDILDVMPPVEIPVSNAWMIWVIAGSVILLAALAFFWVKRWRQKRKVSAKQAAIEVLAQLKSTVFTMDGYHFGVAVSDVMRRYLSEARGLRATQQTSHEFLSDLRERHLFQERQQEQLRVFLESCDLLKYAPAGKASASNEDLLQQADFFIRDDRT